MPKYWLCGSTSGAPTRLHSPTGGSTPRYHPRPGRLEYRDAWVMRSLASGPGPSKVSSPREIIRTGRPSVDDCLGLITRLAVTNTFRQGPKFSRPEQPP